MKYKDTGKRSELKDKGGGRGRRLNGDGCGGGVVNTVFVSVSGEWGTGLEIWGNYVEKREGNKEGRRDEEEEGGGDHIGICMGGDDRMKYWKE